MPGYFLLNLYHIIMHTIPQYHNDNLTRMTIWTSGQTLSQLGWGLKDPWLDRPFNAFWG